jgi:3-deoxy-D-manno-octulosonate 8-phosphate phosphatase (KDO 8-P phosphatase)
MPINYLSNIELMVYDFDGVMTDNKVYIDQNGKEMVQVNRADGLGIEEIKKLGIEQIIISTENNSVVSVRASKLGIPCLQGIKNKKTVLMEYCEKNNIDLQNVAYMGNDINDKEAMEIAGVTFCPADAYDSIIDISNYILKTKGGDGVVRELFNLISRKKGK